MPSRVQLGRISLSSRLLIAQLMVLVASMATTAGVAVLVGPPLFHQHLLRAGHPPRSPELTHIEMAYREANLLSLSLAAPVALLFALLVAWSLTRRIQRPLLALTSAAQELAGGRYQARVPVSSASPELDTVAETFNTMAARLERTEETRRQLLSNLSHELRTPISTIAAFVESLSDGVRQWDADTERIVTDQVNRLTRLADDLREVSQAEEGRIPISRRGTAVGDLLETASRAFTAACHDHGIRLVVEDLTPVGACVEVDPERIGQVVGNLLTNALRHTPAGGSVTVRARQEPGATLISVVDTGEGISSTHLPHVFERFYRADTTAHRADHGSGIGLTISKAIVEAHGGELTADSDGRDRGACFTMTLPITVSTGHAEPG